MTKQKLWLKITIVEICTMNLMYVNVTHLNLYIRMFLLAHLNEVISLASIRFVSLYTPYMIVCTCLDLHRTPRLPNRITFKLIERFYNTASHVNKESILIVFPFHLTIVYCVDVLVYQPVLCLPNPQLVRLATDFHCVPLSSHESAGYDNERFVCVYRLFVEPLDSFTANKAGHVTAVQPNRLCTSLPQ